MIPPDPVTPRQQAPVVSPQFFAFGKHHEARRLHVEISSDNGVMCVFTYDLVPSELFVAADGSTEIHVVFRINDGVVTAQIGGPTVPTELSPEEEDALQCGLIGLQQKLNGG